MSKELAKQIITKFPTINADYINDLANKYSENDFKLIMFDIFLHMPDPKQFTEANKNINMKKLETIIEQSPKLERYQHLIISALTLDTDQFEVLIHNLLSTINPTKDLNKETLNKLIDVFPYLRTELTSIPLTITEEDFIKRCFSKFSECKGMIMKATRDEAKISSSLDLFNNIISKK